MRRIIIFPKIISRRYGTPGIPYGISYCPEFKDILAREFDGYFSSGGSVALPDEWYVKGQDTRSPPSERFTLEVEIIKSFLEADKPFFGSCLGMQLLAGIHGCRLRADLDEGHEDTRHKVEIFKDTPLAALIPKESLLVNSKHKEGLAEISDQVIPCARSEDGLIEAIVIPDKKFAMGLQWHQEEFWKEEHAGNAVMKAFIASCSG